MSRRQAREDETHDAMVLQGLNGSTPGLQNGQTADANSIHLLIYEKDIDDKLDDLNDGPASDDDKRKLAEDICSSACASADGLEIDGSVECDMLSKGTSAINFIPEISDSNESNLKEKTERPFDILIRAVTLDRMKATSIILELLKQRQEDLCDDKYRIKLSTASLLHVALLYRRTEICKNLIQQYPDLLKGKYMYKSADFRHQTCFHIAVANFNCDMIEFMLEKLSDDDEKRNLLNTVADGRYFVEERPEAATCLSAAVWQGHSEMISILVNAGANLDLRGIDDNTLLHYIIYLSTTCLSLDKAQTCIQEVYNCCDVWWVRHKKIRSRSQSKREKDQFRFDAFCHLLRIRNDSGLIPAALAVRIHSPLTRFILNFEPTCKQPQGALGAVAWATYDVTDIVSYKQGQVRSIKRYDCSSVLHTLAHTRRILSKSKEDTKQKDIAELEPINSAIKMKWAVYRWLYLSWFLIHAIYMIALTTTVVLNNMDKNKPNASQTLSYAKSTTEAPINISMDHDVPNNGVRRMLLGLFLVIPVLYVILEVVDLLVSWLNVLSMIAPIINIKAHRAKRLVNYSTNHCTITGNAPYRLLAFCFATCMFTWYGMFLNGHPNCDIPLSLALILGWIFMLNFTRACRHVCRFSIMIQKMFFRDFLYFITVYTFILVAFTSALHLLLPADSNFGNTVMQLLNIVTNAGEPEDEKKPTQKDYAAVVLSMYAILSVILLLNMLIAMMNTSYEAVKSSDINLWRYQQLSILLLLERRFIWWGWLCRRSQSATRRLKMSDEEHSHRVFLDVTEAGNVNVDSKAGKRLDGFILSPSPSLEGLFCSV